jgi:hypothetical protein
MVTKPVLSKRVVQRLISFSIAGWWAPVRFLGLTSSQFFSSLFKLRLLIAIFFHFLFTFHQPLPLLIASCEALICLGVEVHQVISLLALRISSCNLRVSVCSPQNCTSRHPARWPSKCPTVVTVLPNYSYTLLRLVSLPPYLRPYGVRSK